MEFIAYILIEYDSEYFDLILNEIKKNKLEYHTKKIYSIKMKNGIKLIVFNKNQNFLRSYVNYLSNKNYV